MDKRDEMHLLACAITACVVTTEPNKTLMGDTLEDILSELGWYEEEWEIWKRIKQLFQPREYPLGVLKFLDANELYRRAPMMLDWCRQQPAGNARLNIIRRHILA